MQNKKTLYILGISAFYHDSAAALIKNGEIIAAAQEERFSRKKHDASFPREAVAYCLREAGITIADIDYVAFYDKPLLTFERLLETYLAFAPRGFFSFLKSIPAWIKKKIWIKEILSKELKYEGVILFPEHHESHGASAFYPSPFKKAAVLTLDGVGEWTTASVGLGNGSDFKIIADMKFPHSLGLLYSSFTYYLGFKVNSGEYKVMGLAPYGKPKYKDIILNELIDLKKDGSFILNMKYFDYCTGLKMTNKKFDQLFGSPRRKPESALEIFHMDIAASLQAVVEEIVLRIAKFTRQKTGEKNLCMAGGVALNCVANGRLQQANIFDDIWIQPAATDAGGALGAALCVWYNYLGNKRDTSRGLDMQKGSYLGPSYSNTEIESYLKKNNIPYEYLGENELCKKVAHLLNEGNVVGWFQGRMEFGPRALGSRSILGDARNPDMQKRMNIKIKFRESFRPFAPSVLAEKASEYFNIFSISPYMLLVASVAEDKRIKNENTDNKEGLEKLHTVRSVIPAVTHVDYSARVQTVHQETNPKYHKLISYFYELFHTPVIINTSFNVRGEPIVCSPEDAYRCFMRTHMDYLVLENYLLKKSEQKKLENSTPRQEIFKLD